MGNLVLSLKTLDFDCSIVGFVTLAKTLFTFCILFFTCFFFCNYCKMLNSSLCKWTFCNWKCLVLKEWLIRGCRDSWRTVNIKGIIHLDVLRYRKFRDPWRSDESLGIMQSQEIVKTNGASAFLLPIGTLWSARTMSRLENCFAGTSSGAFQLPETIDVKVEGLSIAGKAHKGRQSLGCR